MKYNFDQLSDRRHTSSIKWDVKENELPMWVADMDFSVMDEIKEAIVEAAKQGVYGYSYPVEDYFKAYQSWWERRHNLYIDTKDMIYVSGVVSALDSIIRTLTKENDAVMLLTPTYNGFFRVIDNNKRRLVASPLLLKNDEYVIDYVDVEDKIIKEDVKAIIFCNPHNPIGKIWQKEEIVKLHEITKKHNVFFISDEIHCDIVEPGFQYVPALSIGDDVIMAVAASKVFNLAGLQSSLVVIKNHEIHEKVQDAFYKEDVGEPNYFAIPANIVAFTQGDTYVDELNVYLKNNKDCVRNFINDKLPQLKVRSDKATYLMWIVISSLGMSSDEFVTKLREETGLYVASGTHYGEAGEGYFRINVATSFSNVKDAMNRLFSFINKKQ